LAQAACRFGARVHAGFPPRFGGLQLLKSASERPME